jgi:serine/threonine protein kinase/ABC-type oligopeptide transport system substrate-binding subunit
MRLEVRPGAVLADFRLESLLGEGAMGKVYLAEETMSGRRVALKVLAPDLTRDERFRRRFLRETKLAASLDHPHVVPTLASGEQDGTLYLAMAYVEGSDLRKLLQREGKLEPERALALVEQVASALDAAHGAGLVHRDVKPANILVTPAVEGERAYVCDFGLARHVTSASSLTGERGFVGTIDYVPPEQIEGGTVDGRADVYSLGCVLFECLTGVRPFDRESELAVVFAHLNESPPKVSELRPELPDAFDDVFRTALAKSPDDRYQSCGDLLAAARAALHGKRLPSAKPRRRRLLVVALGLVVVLGATIGGLLATRGESGSFHSGTLLLDLHSRRQIRSMPTSQLSAPAFPVYAGKHFWLLDLASSTFVEIEPANGKVVKRFGTPRGAGSGEPETYQPYAVEGRTLWTGSGDDLVKMDVRRGREVERLSLDKIVGAKGLTEGVAVGGGLVWVSRDAGAGQVVGLDPTTRRVRYRFDDVVHHDDVAYGDGVVWAADLAGVTVIDLAANAVTSAQDVTHTSRFVIAGGGFGWTTNPAKGVAYKIDRNGHVVDTYRTGLGANNMTFSSGVLWVANEDEGTVTGIDAITGEETTHRFDHPVPLQSVGAGVLLAVLEPGRSVEDKINALKGDVVRLFSQQGEYGDGDEPALNPNAAAFQIDFATCAKLLNYPDEGGAAVLRLQPEVAAAMPTVSRDGRTYAFLVRRGYRFSPPTNQPVTAETFRYSIERALSPRLAPLTPGASLVRDIEGERAFRGGRARHIAGLRARGNRLSITLVRPSPDFLERLSLPFFCPVPVGTPFRAGAAVHGGFPLGGGYIPSAGPYFVADFNNDKSIILKRNPNYHGPRPHSLDAIALREGVDAAVATDRVQHAGWDGIVSSGHHVSDSPPLDPLLAPAGALASRYERGRSSSGGYIAAPLPETAFIVLNGTLGPFADRAVRRAAAIATDRAALSAVEGAVPTDQLLPPGFPAYRDRHLFSLRSPDLTRALALMRGRHVDAVMAISTSCQPCVLQARMIRAALSQVGIRVNVRQYANPLAAVAKPHAKIDLLLSRTELDYPDSASFLRQLVLADTPRGWVRADVRRAIDKVARLRGDRRQSAAAALADRLVADDVAVIPWGTLVQGEFFSRRLGCKLFPPTGYGVDLAALCHRG